MATVAAYGFGLGTFFHSEKLPAFALLIGMVLTFLGLRANTHLIRRGVSWWPGNLHRGTVHVHHMVIGVVVMFPVGVVEFAMRPGSPWAEILAFLFGGAAGAVLDEFALVFHLKDVYWEREGRKSITTVFLAVAFTCFMAVGITPLGYSNPAVAGGDSGDQRDRDHGGEPGLREPRLPQGPAVDGLRRTLHPDLRHRRRFPARPSAVGLGPLAIRAAPPEDGQGERSARRTSSGTGADASAGSWTCSPAPPAGPRRSHPPPCRPAGGPSGSRLYSRAALAVVALATFACGQPSSGDAVFAEAFAAHSSGLEVTGEGTVTRLLPDDTDGGRHQRFIVELASGQTLLIAHNIDVAARVNGLQVGDSVSFKGEYEWNDQGGLVHWTHRDSSGAHDDGWIEHLGQISSQLRQAGGAPKCARSASTGTGEQSA